MTKTFVKQGDDGLYFSIEQDSGPAKEMKFPDLPPQAAKSKLHVQPRN